MTHRTAWLEHAGILSIIEGTVILLIVDRLPSGATAKPVWLWWSQPEASTTETDLLWQAFLRRFDIEHTFRMLKQTLGWTSPKLRDPHAADLWTWLVLAAYTQLRLARGAVADLRRDVEKLLAERGIEVDQVTVYWWSHRFTPLLAGAARFARHSPGDRWFADETYVKVNGAWRYVYQAVDQYGQVIDVLLPASRDAPAARRFFTRALRILRVKPNEVVTDAAPVYPAVLDKLIPPAWHHVERYVSNPIEADHGQVKRRLRPMRGLQTDRIAHVVMVGHAFVQNLPVSSGRSTSGPADGAVRAPRRIGLVAGALSVADGGRECGDVSLGADEIRRTTPDFAHPVGATGASLSACTQ